MVLAAACETCPVGTRSKLSYQKVPNEYGCASKAVVMFLSETESAWGQARGSVHCRQKTTESHSQANPIQGSCAHPAAYPHGPTARQCGNNNGQQACLRDRCATSKALLMPSSRASRLDRLRTTTLAQPGLVSTPHQLSPRRGTVPRCT